MGDIQLFSEPMPKFGYSKTSSILQWASSCFGKIVQRASKVEAHRFLLTRSAWFPLAAVHKSHRQKTYRLQKRSRMNSSLHPHLHWYEIWTKKSDKGGGGGGGTVGGTPGWSRGHQPTIKKNPHKPSLLWPRKEEPRRAKTGPRLGLIVTAICSCTMSRLILWDGCQEFSLYRHDLRLTLGLEMRREASS